MREYKMRTQKPRKSPRRFEGRELTEIEQNIDRLRDSASSEFYERLERTLDDARMSEMPDRVLRVKKIFFAVTSEKEMDKAVERFTIPTTDENRSRNME